MAELSNQRRGFRIGVYLIVAPLFVAVFAIAAAVGGGFGAALVTPEAILGWGFAAAMIAIGVGLLRFARLARGAGVLMFGLAAAGSVWSLVLQTKDTVRALRLVPDLAFPLFYFVSVATTLLVVWLCVRAVQALLDREPASPFTTARIVGAGLLVIAGFHVWTAFELGRTSLSLTPGNFGMSIDLQGIVLHGFLGWPIWHLGLLVIAAALLFGPRALLARAALGLVIVFALLGPLALVFVIRAEAGPELAWIVAGQTVLLASLAWWLREELVAARVVDDGSGR